MQEEPNQICKSQSWWEQTLKMADENFKSMHIHHLAMLQAVLFPSPYLEETQYTVFSKTEAWTWILDLLDARAKLWSGPLRLYELKMIGQTWVSNQAGAALLYPEAKGVDLKTRWWCPDTLHCNDQQDCYPGIQTDFKRMNTVRIESECIKDATRYYLFESFSPVIVSHSKQ